MLKIGDVCSIKGDKTHLFYVESFTDKDATGYLEDGKGMRTPHTCPVNSLSIVARAVIWKGKKVKESIDEKK